MYNPPEAKEKETSVTDRTEPREKKKDGKPSRCNYNTPKGQATQ